MPRVSLVVASKQNHLKLLICLCVLVSLAWVPTVGAQNVAPVRGVAVVPAPNGYSVVGYSRRAIVEARYDRRGMPDRKFGHSGFRVIRGLSSVSGATRLRGGDLLVSGTLDTCPSSCASQGVARLIKLDKVGRRDRSFGTAGAVEAYTLGQAGGGPTKPIIDGQGRILIANSSVSCSTALGCRVASTVRRFHRSGAPDETFGEDGVARLPSSPTNAIGDAQVSGITASTSRIAISTAINSLGGSGGSISMLDHSGQLQTTFGDNGSVEVDREPVDVMLIHDDEVVLSGASNAEIYVERLTASGVPDLDFGNGGTAEAPLPTNGTGTWHSDMFAIGKDDAVIGTRVPGPCKGGRCRGTAVIVRLDGSGHPRPTFGIDGRTRIGSGSYSFGSNGVPPFAMGRGRNRILLATAAPGRMGLQRLSWTGQPIH